jgi:hypothetical protein
MIEFGILSKEKGFIGISTYIIYIILSAITMKILKCFSIHCYSVIITEFSLLFILA